MDSGGGWAVRSLYALGVVLCAAASASAQVEKELPPLTVAFTGSQDIDWEAVEDDSVLDEGGKLVLAPEYAVGAADIIADFPAPNPTPPPTQTPKKNKIEVTNVRLVPDAYYLQSVTLRVTTNDGAVDTTTVATVRAYKPERTSDPPTVKASLEIAGGARQEEELTGANIDGTLSIELEIKDGQSQLVVKDADNTSFTVNLPSGAEGEYVSLRVELAGKGPEPESVRPSVEQVEVILVVEETP